MRRTDIYLRWVNQVTIRVACEELSRVLDSYGFTISGDSFATNDSGPWHIAPDIATVVAQQPHLTTGGGTIMNGAGAPWATFSVSNLCERPEPGNTFGISFRRTCTLYPPCVDDEGAVGAREMLEIAHHAAKVSSADYVYGLDVGVFKECFEHPDLRQPGVVVFLGHHLRKVPSFYYFDTTPLLFADDEDPYAFTDSLGRIVARESVSDADALILRKRCRNA